MIAIVDYGVGNLFSLKSSLSMIARYCRLVKYAKNDVLFFEGDTGRNFFFISDFSHRFICFQRKKMK